MKELKEIFVDHIDVEAHAGSEIGACLREAVKLSMEEKVAVRLMHNQREFQIDPKGIIDKIYSDCPFVDQKDLKSVVDKN